MIIWPMIISRINLDVNRANILVTACHSSFYDTKHYAAHAHEGKAIFLVTPKGDVFAGSSVACRFYHSSFVSGSAIFYAGSMKATGGLLKEVDNRSGHYMPTRVHLMRVLDFFNDCGVLNKHTDAMCLSLPDFAKVKIDYPIRKKKQVETDAHRFWPTLS